MSRDDIIRMAREAGSIDSEEVIETVWRAFSAAEREACAKVCEQLGEDSNYSTGRVWGRGCAAAIRARSTP